MRSIPRKRGEWVSNGAQGEYPFDAEVFRPDITASRSSHRPLCQSEMWTRSTVCGGSENQGGEMRLHKVSFSPFFWPLFYRSIVPFCGRFHTSTCFICRRLFIFNLLCSVRRLARSERRIFRIQARREKQLDLNQ